MTVARLGQNAEATFDASAGNHLSLGITENTFTSLCTITVIAPSGAKVLNSAQVSASSAKTQGLPDLSETGTYTVIMDPYNGAQGSFKLSLSADVTVNVGVDGASVPATVSRPGQRMRATFTAPDSADLGVGLTGNSINQITYINLIGPTGGDGSLLTTMSKNTAQAAHLNSLTAGSSYALLLEPQSAGTGSVTLWLSAAVNAGAVSKAGSTRRPAPATPWGRPAAPGAGSSGSRSAWSR